MRSWSGRHCNEQSTPRGVEAGRQAGGEVPRRRLRSRRRCGGIVDDVPADEVSLDDLFQDLGGAGVVPDPFRVDDGDGALDAELEAVGFRAEDAAFAGED